MPCFNEGEAEAREAENKRYQKWASHNSIPADLLCMVLRNATESGLYPAILGALPGPFHREKLDKWWREHQVRDEFKNEN